jgi:hypothetical protein
MTGLSTRRQQLYVEGGVITKSALALIVPLLRADSDLE